MRSEELGIKRDTEFQKVKGFRIESCRKRAVIGLKNREKVKNLKKCLKIVVFRGKLRLYCKEDN